MFLAAFCYQVFGWFGILRQVEEEKERVYTIDRRTDAENVRICLDMRVIEDIGRKK